MFMGGVACALLVALSILATYPVVEMGVNDDWSYTKTALTLVRTGHIVYNGWATAMLGWQIFWGALFIQLFGYSVLVVRLSTLPIAMGCAFLLFWLCNRFGLNARSAFLATCTVVLSPLFVPMAASYMTDVPGFFVILFCLVLCVKALDSETASGSILWLAAASVMGVIGGTCRQVAWLAPLVMVPSTGWLLKGRRYGVAMLPGLWLLSLATIFACTNWFNHQPYAIPEKLIKSKLQLWLIRKSMAEYRDLILTIFLFALPVLVAYLSVIWQVSRKILIPLLLVAAAVIAVAYRAGGNGLAPFLTNVVTPLGVGGAAGWQTLGYQPIVLGPLLRLFTTSLMAVALCVALAFTLSRFPFKQPAPSACSRVLSWRSMFYLLAPFIASYLVLLAPRAVFAAAYDRYAIPLLGLCVIPLLRFYQEQISLRVPWFCFVVLAAFGGYAVLSTHDYFATNRARFAAAQEVLQAGVTRTELQAGWELDGETQIDLAGYINDPRLQNPPGAYKPFTPSPRLPQACQTEWSSEVPVIQPKYFVVFSPQPCLAPSAFAPISYSTWWPPVHRQIYIQQLPTGPGETQNK